MKNRKLFVVSLTWEVDRKVKNLVVHTWADNEDEAYGHILRKFQGGELVFGPERRELAWKGKPEMAPRLEMTSIRHIPEALHQDDAKVAAADRAVERDAEDREIKKSLDEARRRVSSMSPQERMQLEARARERMQREWDKDNPDNVSWTYYYDDYSHVVYDGEGNRVAGQQFGDEQLPFLREALKAAGVTLLNLGAVNSNLTESSGFPATRQELEGWVKAGGRPDQLGKPVPGA